jgi:hypothetical protein
VPAAFFDRPTLWRKRLLLLSIPALSFDAGAHFATKKERFSRKRIPVIYIGLKYLTTAAQQNPQPAEQVLMIRRPEK